MIQIIIMILVVLDISFTYYFIFLHIKHNIKNYLKLEANFIPRMLIKYMGVSPSALLAHCGIQILLFSVILIFTSNEANLIILGILIMLDVYHLNYFFYYQKDGKKPKFWVYRKIIIDEIIE